VQDGGCGAVGATKYVEEMMAGDGIVIGCGDGLKRNRAAIRITRTMMPPMMSKGRRDLLDSAELFNTPGYSGCCIHAGSGVSDGQTEPGSGVLGIRSLLEAGIPLFSPDLREIDFLKNRGIYRSSKGR
jgi:hypothetical protein